MDYSLKGKNAIVGGSSKGIGRASAVALASMGASVIVVSRTEKLLKEVREGLPVPEGQKHGYIVADFSEPQRLKEVVNDYLAGIGKPIHILVNNTGGPPAGPIVDAEPAEFLEAFNMHLLCNHIMVKAVMEGMKKEGYGRIINIISTSVKEPLKGLGVSNTIRGAVGNWSKTMANELGQHQITVNNILPGATDTDRLQSIILRKAGDESEESIQKVVDAMQGAIPMKRFAKPEEIAAVVAFLASPAASYINGINMPVDGGRTASL